MKTKYILTTPLGLMLITSGYADLSVTAPGLTAVHQLSGTSSQAGISLGKYWSYEITGYDYRLVPSVPSNGAVDSNGDFKANNSSAFYGQSTIYATAKGKQIVNAQHTATNIYDVSSKSASLTSPIEFDNENVIINVSQTANMQNTAGSYLAIQGVAMKDPPVPTGDLEIGSYVREGSTPLVSWSIQREGTMGVSPALPSSVTEWTPIITPGETPPFVDEEPEVNDEEATDAPNSDKNKTNNGHGNNADGVDVSNPGKSAQVWNDKFGIIDQSGSYDDEAKGNGSAVSKNNKNK